MRKILAFLVCLVLMSSVALADGNGGQGSGDMGGEPMQASGDISQDAGKGEKSLQQEGATVMSHERARNTEELRQMVQSRQKNMDQEMGKMDAKQQEVYRNQNKVRLAVHSLLAMEDIVGGIGPQVSEVAKNFNNSVQATIRAEEKIQTRNVLARLFAGGNHESAGEIEREVEQNRQMVQQLNQLREQCDCEEEVKAMMQEQIQNMEQEQSRLSELAQKEKQSKGIFGWLWK